MKFKESPGLMNKNFQWGDEVVFVNTGSNELEGRIGKVVGKPVIDLCDFYLVDLGEPVSNTRPDTVVFITEACLNKAPEKPQTRYIPMPSGVNNACLDAYEGLIIAFSNTNSNDIVKNDALDKFFSIINQYDDAVEFGIWALRSVICRYKFISIDMKKKNIKEFYEKYKYTIKSM